MSFLSTKLRSTLKKIKMTRVDIKVNDHVLARLDAISDLTGLSRSSIFLASFAEYRADVQPEAKRKPRAKKKGDSDLGVGNKPKDINEVIKYFTGKVNSPVKEKAEQFFSYYQQQGWKLSNGNSVKEWGACLRGWLQRHPEWRPLPSVDREEISLDEFMDWCKEHRKPWFEKFRGVTKLSEVSDFYVEEFTNARAN